MDPLPKFEELAPKLQRCGIELRAVQRGWEHSVIPLSSPKSFCCSSNMVASAGGGEVLHGLGLAIVAMSSPGRLSTQAYSWGIAHGPVQIRPAGPETGTRVTVQLTSDAPEIESGEVLVQVEAWRATHPELRIEVTDEEHAL